jgi:hypothetical protein
MKIATRNFVCLLLCLCYAASNAQDARLRIGVGANFVSNNYKEQYLGSFGSYSLNTSYTLMQQARYLVVWEQNILLHNNESNGWHKRAVVISSPFSFRVQPGYKTGLYLGLGPTYLRQRYDDYSITQRVRGWHATAQAGVAFKSKPIAEAVFVEYHLKAGVHHSLNGSGNMAPFVTLAVQLGANQRVQRIAKRKSNASNES